MEQAIKSLGNDKRGGSDNIEAELLKLGESDISEWMTRLFNEVLATTTVPSQWKSSIIVLLHKKGDKCNINNWRPISLISTIYKVFAKCLLNRLKPILESNQPPEQAAFRRGFSTIDHLHSINQLLEKSREYQITLYFAFIDFTKAFDTIEHDAIWSELKTQGVPIHFIEVLKKLYKNSTAFVKTETTGRTFEIKRGVKQGDPLSPALFSAVLEGVFRKLDWDEKGIRINGKWLSDFRFADDIVVISENPHDIQRMIDDLSYECGKVGLEMNRSKTKMMSNGHHTDITLNGESLEYVEDFIYLGQLISFKDKNKKETSRRITNGWKQFWNLNHLLKLRLPMKQKKEIFDSSIISVLNYASQTRTNNQIQLNSLRTCQRSMERSLLNIRRTDRIRSSEIRGMTKFADVVVQSRQLKWDWAGHVARMQDDRWTNIITNWTPLDRTRQVGRQPKRWRDDLCSFRQNYQREATDRKNWKRLGEMYSSNEV